MPLGERSETHAAGAMSARLNAAITLCERQRRSETASAWRSSSSCRELDETSSIVAVWARVRYTCFYEAPGSIRSRSAVFLGASTNGQIEAFRSGRWSRRSEASFPCWSACVSPRVSLFAARRVRAPAGVCGRDVELLGRFGLEGLPPHALARATIRFPVGLAGPIGERKPPRTTRS